MACGGKTRGTRERMTGILPPVAHQASINTLERHWGQKEGRTQRERERLSHRNKIIAKSTSYASLS